MSVVHQPVKDRVGDGGFADRLMPVVHRDLGGRERGTVPVTVVKNLKQIAPRGIGQRCHGQIVENHEIRLGKLCEPSRVAPAAVCNRQFLVQFWHAQIAGGETLAARLDGEGATQPTLAESGRTRNILRINTLMKLRFTIRFIRSAVSTFMCLALYALDHAHITQSFSQTGPAACCRSGCANQQRRS
jgi:hypothetical protein